MAHRPGWGYAQRIRTVTHWFERRYCRPLGRLRGSAVPWATTVGTTWLVYGFPAANARLNPRG